MSSFETSTQRKDWLFSRDKLRSIREQVNQKVTSRVCHHLSDSSEAVGASPSPSTSMSTSVDEPDTGKLGSSCLTLEEGVELVKYYSKKMLEMCKTQDYIDTVRFTAVMLYRRFFLFSSLMEHDPTLMLLAAVFVAGKAEEAPLTMATRGIDIVKLCGVTKMDLDKLLQSEISFLQGVKFHLVVFHPHRPFLGFIDALKKEIGPDAVKDKQEILDDMRRRGQTLLEASLLTDCALLFAPSQVALAAIVSAAEEAGETSGLSAKYVFDVLVGKPVKGAEDDAGVLKETEEVVAEIQEMLKQGEAPADKKLYKSASKKLKHLQKMLSKRKPTSHQHEANAENLDRQEEKDKGKDKDKDREQRQKKKLKSIPPPPLPTGPPPPQR